MPLSSESDEIRRSLESFLKLIVNAPEEVVVEATPGATTLELAIYTADSDIGKIIGGGGSTIKALRVLYMKAALHTEKFRRCEVTLPNAPIERNYNKGNSSDGNRSNGERNRKPYDNRDRRR